MNKSLKNGDKVTVTTGSAKNGYSDDQENVKKHLKIGEEYTIKDVNVKAYFTDVYLQEVPNVKFNSVNFVNV
jgi:hypothetical protein